MNVAIIPARGGSKRIPNKNIKSFAGKPIIAYSIEAAKLSGVFDRIVVSTDSEKIAEVAREYDAEIPFLRPAELADDHAREREPEVPRKGAKAPPGEIGKQPPRNLTSIRY